VSPLNGATKHVGRLLLSCAARRLPASIAKTTPEISVKKFLLMPVSLANWPNQVNEKLRPNFKTASLSFVPRLPIN
jgi:hypothetical protein